MNMRKYPKNPLTPRSLYDISPIPPNTSIRVVTFIEKANPIIIPARARNPIFFFFVHSSLFHRNRRMIIPIILILRRAGSSFMSFAC
jgi:hypothetical protein